MIWLPVYEGCGVECHGLNENGPHRLLGSSAARKCVLVGVGVSLLEKVWHWGWGSEVSDAKVKPSVTLSSWCLQSGCRTLSYFFRTMSACIPSCFLSWWLNLWTCKAAAMKCFSLRVDMVMVSLHNNKTQNKTSSYEQILFYIILTCKLSVWVIYLLTNITWINKCESKV